MTENKADPLRYALQRIAWLDPSAPIGEPPDPQYLIRQAQGIARDALASAPQPVAAPLVRDLCGDDLNGGFIRDLCFTVWKICHEPKHSDGNSDWGSDTLPVVQEAVRTVRQKLEAILAAIPQERGVDREAIIEECVKAAEIAFEESVSSGTGGVAMAMINAIRALGKETGR